MQPFDLIGHWFWLLCLGFGWINFRRADAQARERFAGDPPRAAQAERLMRLFALFNALPWLVMGVGVLVGGVPGVWSYFRPQDGNPYVWAWFASALLMSIVFAVWVFAFDGAATMSDLGLGTLFGGRGGRTQMSPATIKLTAAFGPLFIVLWIWLASSMNVPLPHP
jgi:hypothetical protein